MTAPDPTRPTEVDDYLSCQACGSYGSHECPAAAAFDDFDRNVAADALAYYEQQATPTFTELYSEGVQDAAAEREPLTAEDFAEWRRECSHDDGAFSVAWVDACLRVMRIRETGGAL